MFIIWGSRARKKAEDYLPSEGCIVCNNHGLHVLSIRRWFTFFFIPIFPTGRKKYYLTCLECENCYRLKSDVNIQDLLNPSPTHQNEAID